MAGSPSDFRVELIRCRPQGIVSPTLGSPVSAEPLDLTSRVPRDGFGSINRAMERDLLSFKTGDLTLTMMNRDGFLDDVFSTIVFGPTTVWSLRVYRRGDVQFWGAVIGRGSITFDRKAKTCELTAYGLTKILDMTSAETVKRTVPAMTYVSGAAGPPPTHTFNTSSGLLSGDTLHITDHVNAEDMTVLQVTSGTTVSIETALANAYAAGSEVTLTTPYYRYKTISALVSLLFTEAGIGMAELKISNSQFSTLGPTPVNQSGLATFTASNPVYTCPAQRNGRRYDTHLVDGTYYQATPDADWVKEDATVRAWVDWSPYYLQGSAGPAIVPRASNLAAAGNGIDPHHTGWDLRSATMRMYHSENGQLRYQETTDGTTYGVDTAVPTPAVPDFHGANGNEIGCDFDPVRNQVLCWSTDSGAAGGAVQLYDVAGDTWTDCRQADDAATNIRYGGFTYCRDLDCFIGLRTTGANPKGPAFDIVAFRGSARLWKRTFPNILVNSFVGGAGGNGYTYPTHSLRYVNGILYVVVISDGKAQIVYSKDQFQTYTMRALTDPAGSGNYIFAGRVNGNYEIACNKSGLQRGLFTAAPFYAGVINYADFEGNSIAEALKKLAILSNALFWVDDDLQGHFVARDLYDASSVTNISTRIKEQRDTALWDQTSQYVTVSGGGFDATAGDAGFSSEGIELQSDFNPTEAFAQALADAYFAFYGAQRAYQESVLHDTDGTIFRPLDRVTSDGASRYLIYESDHSLMDDEVSLTLLEDR